MVLYAGIKYWTRRARCLWTGLTANPTAVQLLFYDCEDLMSVPMGTGQKKKKQIDIETDTAAVVTLEQTGQF